LYPCRLVHKLLLFLAISLIVGSLLAIPAFAQEASAPPRQQAGSKDSLELKAAEIIERLAKENPLNKKDPHANVLSLRQYYSPRGNAYGECYGSAKPSGLSYWRSGIGSTLIPWSAITSYCKEPGPCCVLVLTTKQQTHTIRYYPDDFAWLTQILEYLNVPHTKDC